MTISVTCKKCGKVLKSPAQFAGKPVKCPDCDTINRLPDAAADESTSQAEVCCLCGADFSSDSNQAKDTKGNFYHRNCYDKKKAEKEATELCRLCGENFAADPDRVKDAKGNLFHRDCYNQKKESADKQRRALQEKEKRELKRQEEEKRRRELQERERKKREQEKRRREAKPAAKEKIEPREEKCELCGESLSSATNRITDLKGHVFHQTCYDNRQGGAGGQRSQCQLCGQRFADAANVVKDPHGRYYHRNCYEEEKARLAPLDLSNVPEVDALDEFDDEPPVAEAQVVASKEPHPSQLPRPPEPEDEFRLAPIDGESKPRGKAPVAGIVEPSDDEDIPTLVAAEDADLVPIDDAGLVPIDNSGLVPIDNAGLVPVDNGGLTPIDGSLLQGPGSSPFDPLAGAVLEPASPGAGGLARGKESMPTWLYVLMGCGAVVPVMVLLYIIVTSILGPSQPATGPVATAEQRSPADIDSTDPTPATSPYSPPVPGQPSGGQVIPPSSGSYNEPPSNGYAPPQGSPEEMMEMLLAAGSLGLCCVGVALLITTVIRTVLFQAACSICREELPEFGFAFLVLGAIVVVEQVCVFLFNPASLGLLGAFVMTVVPFVLLNTGVFTVAFRFSFPKALLIAIVQIVLFAVCVFVLAFVVGFVIAVIAANGA